MTAETLINVGDYHRVARERLPRMVYDYYAGGAWDELTLGWNERAYDRLELRYRVLRDVVDRDPSAVVLGRRVSMPILIAPTAFHGMAHADGERATAAAAGATGTVMIASTLSNRPIEEIVAATNGDVWFQLYVYKDRAISKGLVERARDAGCSALVVTVDVPGLGRRERDVRNRFQLPEELGLGNLASDLDGLPEELSGSALAAYVGSTFDPSLTWEDLGWLRSLSDLPVVVKGVIHPDDARLAAENGAGAVFVSNHGGRQLDTAPATLDALPEIVEAVDGGIEVYVDGGVRRGTDVVKALALGADAVAVGRPILWGLAVDGRVGVEQVLEILRTELDAAMAMCGVTRVDQITADLVSRTSLR